jgi:hypothetical protein
MDAMVENETIQYLQAFLISRDTPVIHYLFLQGAECMKSNLRPVNQTFIGRNSCCNPEYWCWTSFLPPNPETLRQLRMLMDRLGETGGNENGGSGARSVGSSHGDSGGESGISGQGEINEYEGSSGRKAKTTDNGGQEGRDDTAALVTK